MFGSPKVFGQQQRIAADTYQVFNDSTGVIKALLRAIVQTYRVSNQQLPTVPPAVPTHALWDVAMRQAFYGQDCDVGQLSSLLSPMPLDVNSAVMKTINSLPKCVLDDIFVYQCYCNSCRNSFSGIFAASGPKYGAVCYVCYGLDVVVTKHAKLRLIKGYSAECKIIYGGNSWVLMLALARKEGMISSLFSDFFAKDQFNFTFSCVKRLYEELSICDMTFLRPEAAYYWLQGQRYKCYQMAGSLELYVYFDMRYCKSTTAQMNVESMYRNMGQLVVDQPVSVNYPGNPLEDNVITTTTEPILEQYKPVVYHRFISDLVITPWMIVMMVVAALLLIINVVLMSILQNMKNNTMVLKNLDYSGQLNLGYTGAPPVAGQVPSKLAAAAYSVLTDSAYIPYLTAYSVSVSGLSTNCTFQETLNLDSADLSNTTITITDFVADSIEVNNMTFTYQMQLQPGIDISGLNLYQLSANYMRATTLNSMGSFTVNSTLAATQKAYVDIFNSATVQTDNLTARGASNFSNLTATNMYVRDVSTEQQISCPFDITIAGKARLLNPEFNNYSSIIFYKAVVFENTNASGVSEPLRLAFPQNLAFNATTNINGVIGNANVSINSTNASNFSCDGAACAVSVPSVSLKGEIIVNGPVTLNNFTTTGYTSKTLQTSQVIVPDDNAFTPPKYVLGVAGLNATLPVSLGGVNISESAIAFGTTGDKVAFPGMTADITNFTLRGSSGSQTLAVSTKDLQAQTVYADTVAVTGVITSDSLVVSYKLVAATLEAAAVKAASITQTKYTGQTCYPDSTAIKCDFFVNGKLATESLLCNAICNTKSGP